MDPIKKNKIKETKEGEREKRDEKRGVGHPTPTASGNVQADLGVATNATIESGDPFQRSTIISRSPPSTSKEKHLTKVLEKAQKTPNKGKDKKNQTRPEEEKTKDLAGDKINAQKEVMITGGLTAYTSPKKSYIAKMRNDEEGELRKCVEIIAKMKKALQRQRNISMDVKIGLEELEEALDVINCYRSSWKKAEEEVNATTPREKDTDPRGEKSAANTATTGGKRAASSPADIKTGKRKKSTSLETPKTIDKATTKGVTLSPWTMVRSKKDRKATETKNKREATRTQKKKKRQSKPRSDAILIKPTVGITYAEVLREIRSKTNPEASQVEVRSIRQTRSGGVLLELGDKKGDKESFQSSLANILGGNATVQRLEAKETIEIRDLDTLTTQEEVTEAIKKMGGELVGEPKVSLTKENSRGLKMAIVELSARGAGELLKLQRIKIGWVNCRVRRRLMIPRCYTCFGYGHQQAECKGPHRRQLGVCIRCGEQRYKKNECKAQAAKCFLCTEQKVAPNQLEHIPGSGNCLVFRQALEESEVSAGNLHRSRVADDLLTQITRDVKADLVIISEQYRNREQPRWYSDILNTAAIWIPEGTRISTESHGSNRGFVWIRSNKVVYVSCYLTPNESIQEFQEKLDNLEDTIQEWGEAVVVAGDFNARAVEWGMPNTDSRGRRVLEMAARLNLNVINTGNVSTFRRPGYAETIPDITLVSESLATKISGWNVSEEYTGSDHQYITFHLQEGRRRESDNCRRTNGWNVDKLNREALVATIEGEANDITNDPGPAELLVEDTMRLIQQACDASMPRRRRTSKKRRPVYWWTDEIAALRRRCLSLRRTATRRRRNGGTSESETSEYKEARRELKRAIGSSKRRKWEELRAEVNNDPWGLGYKITMRKLGAHKASPCLDATRTESIVNALFPTHPVRAQEQYPTTMEEAPPFTVEELKEAAGAMQNKKAPGPDGIPTEVLKVLAELCPEILLKMYNCCLKKGIFPRRWKVQRLVLISKGKGDPETPAAYRPLCMLDTAGKLLERLLKPRLASAIQNTGGLSDKQYGFRKGRATIGAVEEVVKAFHAAQQGNHHSRKVVLLAALDVKNAFNSARWCDMLNALEHTFRIPQYLLRIVKSYLHDRVLLYDTTEGPGRRKITAGAAQGSILGPELWNISYDGILRMDMPEESFLVGYADDIAAVIVARDIDAAQLKLNQVMRRVTTWMEEHGLSLATQKTEIVLLTRRRIPTIRQVRVGDEDIGTSQAVKYLGIKLDSKLTFWEHIRYAADKAAQNTTQLSRLMANVGGPSASKRRLLMAVTHSTLLYGCEIWADAMRVDKYRKLMAAVQRRGALRVASAYRTVSEPAVLVVAGVTPIDLMALERKERHEKQAEIGKEAARNEASEHALARWQERWETETRGSWTARLIPDLRKWLKREHGEVNYYLTQCLTGHGLFNAYLHKMGKIGSPACQYGDSLKDDAQHTFFGCKRWTVERRQIEEELGGFTPEEMVNNMLRGKEQWDRVAGFIQQILQQKKKEAQEAPDGQ